MFSVHFLPAAARHNLCSHTQNQGNCRGSADHYSLGRFQIPTDLENPNGPRPDKHLRFKVVYFKYGHNRNSNSTRSPTYDVIFDNSINKWKCDCPHFLSSQQSLNLCCKHIQGCIDLRAAFDRFNDVRYLDLLGDHLFQITEEEYNNIMAE